MASNYEKSVFKHLEETLKKVDIVLEENERLQAKIEVMEAEYRKEIRALKAEIDKLKAEHQKESAVLNAEIDRFKKENQKLKDIISLYLTTKKCSN